jgi:hypothetical protein
MKLGDELQHDVEAAAEFGLRSAAELVLQQAQRNIPVGDPDVDPDPNVTLRDSGQHRGARATAGSIIFDTPYAAKVHEDQRLQAPRGGTAKYLERAVTTIAPTPRPDRVTSQGGGAHGVRPVERTRAGPIGDVVPLPDRLRDHLVAAEHRPQARGGRRTAAAVARAAARDASTRRGQQPVEVGSDLVLGAFLTGGFAPPPYGSFLRKPIVDIRFRGKSPQNIETTELAITKSLIDRRDWTMGGMYVVECEQWRPLQRLGSDEQGFEYVAAYWFELIRPIVPAACAP